MVREIINVEVEMVLKKLLNEKVFSIDGFLVEFFKVNWDIVGVEVCMVIK